VDASGFRYAEEGERTALAGQDIRLTLDTAIQQALEHALEGQRGAGVVINPRNGDVLAMASSPTFAPEDIRSIAKFELLSRDHEKPLYNRAIGGVYPPGSVFKPVVAIASLENGRATGKTEFTCPGYFEVGGVRFHCWSRRGHARIGMRKAIEQSCNAYFCQLGLHCGYERIYHMAEAIGFGYRTDVRLPGEARGLLPGEAWKRRVHHDGWRSGDTCNVSIGQGALLVTPLQMAVFTAAVANGGRVWRPRLVVRADGSTVGELANEMGWSPATLAVVRGGMYDVIQAEHGTGKRAMIPGIEMAGKTGSAEYGPRSDRKKHAWMILFAPYRQPRYAVSLVIEDAVSGGITTAPRMRELMLTIFGVTKPEYREGEGGSV
jgi:penicillin-binding protein 2